MDAVVSYHLTTIGCGIAKFNAQLAQRLGVPCVGFGAPAQHPLISLAIREWPDWANWIRPVYKTYDLFFHDIPDVAHDASSIGHAGTVYAGNAEIAAALRPLRPDVQEVWCPSLAVGSPERSGYRILTFGMAMKQPQQGHLQRLKDVMGASHADYTINLSAAVHAGPAWEVVMAHAWEALTAIFGSHARLLGYLADDALLVEMRRSHAVAAFYNPAVRANNTTAWTPIQHGVVLITNLDRYSPEDFVHDATVLDIAHLERMPTPDRMRAIRGGAAKVAETYSWDRLLAQIQTSVTV